MPRRILWVVDRPAIDAQPGREGGRARQRRRTRRAILAAASELMAAGGRPSVADVAEAADVSKRTVYLYFPTHEQLLLDAALGLMGWEQVEAALQHSDSVEDRVAAVVRAMTDMSPETERAGRELIRLTVHAPPPGEGMPRRGYRRIDLLERALEPVREQLGDAAFERLVSGLAMLTGLEAAIVQRDLRGLDPPAGADVSEWAARALLRAALAEAGNAEPGSPQPLKPPGPGA
jgi:AcrR family transcriptional regulator